MAEQIYSVSDFQALTNQILETSFSGVTVEGEVSEFKVNQNKYVFFNLKDEESSIGCFMTVWQLHYPLEDGMKIIVRATPKLTTWGKFSLTVHALQPVGEGSLKKSFEALKKKLSQEGLFDPTKKRPLPSPIRKIGVISSIQAAGYADFCKILNERWGGLEVITAHVQVQGLVAPEQMIRAFKYFNERNEVDVIALIRGGGSADDLASFNDEELVRTIASSKIPVITGIGHEVDQSLSDLAANLEASTPSNVAQMLTPDKRAVKREINNLVERSYEAIITHINTSKDLSTQYFTQTSDSLLRQIDQISQKIKGYQQLLEHVNPLNVLKNGYALLRGELKANAKIEIATYKKIIQAQIINIKERKSWLPKKPSAKKSLN